MLKSSKLSHFYSLLFDILTELKPGGEYAFIKAMNLIGIHRPGDHYLFVFLSVKLEKCANLCECTSIEGNCNILVITDYVVARNSTAIAHK